MKTSYETSIAGCAADSWRIGAEKCTTASALPELRTPSARAIWVDGAYR
jgi:hypothetical protein